MLGWHCTKTQARRHSHTLPSETLLNGEMSLFSAPWLVRTADTQSGHCGPFLRVPGTSPHAPLFFQFLFLPPLVSLVPFPSLGLPTTQVCSAMMDFSFFPQKKIIISAFLHRHSQAYPLSPKRQTHSQKRRPPTPQESSSSTGNI